MKSSKLLKTVRFENVQYNIMLLKMKNLCHARNNRYITYNIIITPYTVYNKLLQE